ncbi:hypothetical protein E2562_030807 [Oryza meyeriana var. granulata]|uniref:Uncharacterized protein n=1 Tax=Oryza meyeriana var. granulata TaxID=110450 RepID=A0A6G1DBD8_9ORYZ|nr:hypothetical protein E2562_030807 [Oryza meyeriana var. granulata]
MATAAADDDDQPCRPPRDVSAPLPVHPRTGWPLFERRVAQGDLASVAAGTTAAASSTTNGREVRVSLRLAAPPASSCCVQLYTDDEYWDPRTATSSSSTWPSPTKGSPPTAWTTCSSTRPTPTRHRCSASLIPPACGQACPL